MQLENTEDFYPLSPLQEGLLFHALYSPEGGVYISQISCAMRGDLNVLAFKQAWRQVVERHAALRTFFVWEGLKKPVQVVQRNVDLSWEQLDWRGLSRESQSDELQAYLSSERTRGFQLSHAPLMRLTLIQMANDEYQFVWSHHHILLDGWSGALVSREVISFYEALSRGEDLHLPRPRPYRDYIAWLQRQDLAAAEGYWRSALQGFTTPTPLVTSDGPVPAREEGVYTGRQVRLSTEATAGLQAAARKNGLTLNTLVQGAWALLLSRHSGRQDVLFGAIVSGRPPDLEGIEEMVGVFINTLAVRVRVSPDMSVADWLQQLQDQQLEARQYEYSPLSKVQGWSEVGRGRTLFESIMVFENYPVRVASPTPQVNGGLGAWDIHYLIKESYPMTLVVEPGTQLLLEVKYDSSLFDVATIARISGHLEILLRNVLTQRNVWQQTVREILDRTNTEQQLNDDRRLKQVRFQMLKDVKRKIVATLT